jgi:hypothetical protein
LKPEGAVFDRSWRERSQVVPCSITDVDEFVRHHHYLHKRPGVVVLAMMLTIDGFANGTVVYSLPPLKLKYGMAVRRGSWRGSTFGTRSHGTPRRG